MVQEDGDALPTRGYIGGVMLNGSGALPYPQFSGNFAKLTLDADAQFARDDWAYGVFAFQNCELYNGNLTAYAMQNAYFTNSLFFRVFAAFYDQDYAISFNIENCTFYDGFLGAGRWSGQSGDAVSFWQIENTAFDGTDFSWTDNYNGNTNILFNYNAYNTNNLGWTNYPFPYTPDCGTNEVTGPNDLMVTNYNWETNWFGNFYLPTNSPLIRKGSTNASCVGLYEFTTQTNQTIDGTNLVTIGYHYVATGVNGNPLDTYVSGIPNYIVDSQGSGMDTNGLPYWWEGEYFGEVGLNPNSDPDGDGNNLLYDYTNGIDPNVIQFMSVMTNNYVTTNVVSAKAIVSEGIPHYEAVLVNDTNFADAVWEPYTSSNILVTLGTTDRVYNVWIGLRGLPASATQTWDTGDVTFYLDHAAPVVTITNPASSTVTRPYVQIQGFANKQLTHISWDITNAWGLATNLPGFVTDQYYDTNAEDYTTNYFQCYDVPLTNGLNVVSVHVWDRAGNETTANLNLTLNYSSATNPPVVTLVWPQDGMEVSGTNFTLRGRISDETADVSAQIVDTNGDTNVVSGIVERNGKFWVENLPLTNGDNEVTVTATDAAGNVTTTNITVSESSAVLTINSTPTGDDLYQPSGTVTGEVSNNTYTVTVNGVTATISGSQNGDGNWSWEADNVPILGAGTATFDAVATPSGSGSPADASTNIEKGPIAVIVECDANKTYDQLSPTSTNNWSWDKNYSASYNSDETLQGYQGKVTSYTSWSNIGGGEWQQEVYTWASSNAFTYYTDSLGNASTNDSIDIADISFVESLPDMDVGALGYLGEGGVYLYHYYGKGVDWSWSDTNGNSEEVTLGAHTKVKLLTGGKGTINRQNVFCISGWATAFGQPFDPPWLYTPAWSLDPTTITVGGQPLDTNGNAYVIYPDNSQEDLTTVAPVDHYDAGWGYQKYHCYYVAHCEMPDPGGSRMAIYTPGDDFGHSWWEFDTDIPMDVLSKVWPSIYFDLGLNPSLYIGSNGYFPTDASIWTALGVDCPGILYEPGAGIDNVTPRQWEIGINGLESGLIYTANLSTHPGSYDIASHNCTTTTVDAGKASLADPPNDWNPQNFGIDLNKLPIDQ